MSTDKDYSLKKLQNFKGRKGPGMIIIMDGVGIGNHGPGDAVYQANPPNLNNWIQETQKQNLYSQLKAHGLFVGLPSDGDMGNSEVGHNALGSGQIYNQGAKLVNDSLDSGRVFSTPTWDEIIGSAARNQKTAHFIGLLSNGNVHSHIDQLFKLLDGTVKSGIKRIRVHPLLDGRDVAPDSGLIFIEQLEEKLATLEKIYGIDAKIGSGGGRMYVVMDRYESNWEIVRRGWDSIVRGKLADEDITAEYPGYFECSADAIKTAREVYPKKLDQYNPPWVIIDSDKNPIGRVADGDAVVNFNFRGDRAIEITKAFIFDTFSAFDRVIQPKVQYAGLLEYDGDAHIPPKFLVPPPEIQYVSGRYFTNMKIPSYAIAETHKFGHVTYFWNGNNSGYLNKDYELYEEIKSEPNEMIEGHPEMKAAEVTEKLLERINENKFKYLRVNYANCDMVGHTGNINSGIRAVKAVDKSLEQVVKALMDLDGYALITADHGNVEEMLNSKGKVVTAHSTNPVPFFILDSQYSGEYQIDTSSILNPGISNIMATFMNLMGYEAPPMYQQSLLKFK